MVTGVSLIKTVIHYYVWLAARLLCCCQKTAFVARLSGEVTGTPLQDRYGKYYLVVPRKIIEGEFIGVY